MKRSDILLRQKRSEMLIDIRKELRRINDKCWYLSPSNEESEDKRVKIIECFEHRTLTPMYLDILKEMIRTWVIQMIKDKKFKMHSNTDFLLRGETGWKDEEEIILSIIETVQSEIDNARKYI